ncbi:MAG: PKD domain-containing protein, partial [Sulfurovum sp.]|nr:PKD domain-containing protein [Sulfurovum sp.]
MRGSERLVDRVQALAMFFRKSGIQKSLIISIFLLFSLPGIVEAATTVTCSACPDEGSCDRESECESYPTCTWEGHLYKNDVCRDKVCSDISNESTCNSSPLGCHWEPGILGFLLAHCAEGVANTPPTAVAGPDQSVIKGVSVTLDGSGSSDSDGSIASWSWSDGSHTWSGATPTIFTDTWSIGEHTITLTVEDDDGDTGTDTLVITVNEAESMPIAENANDLCYGEIIEEPLDDIPYMYKRTVPILNQGEGNLTEVNLIFATNGLLDIIQMNFDCGIDDQSKIGSGECAYADTNGLGNLGLELDWLISTTLLHDVIHYAMPDYSAYDPHHSIYHKHGDNVDLSGTQIYAMYIKDNILHRGRIDSCDISSNPPFQNEYTCGTFPSVLTSYEHMTLSKNQIFNSCTISYPTGEFSQDHNNAPVCYTDLTTSELCEDLDGIAENGNCNFVPEPVNRYDHDFIETTDSTTTNENADITLTDLEYGNYTFDGNGQKIRFNPFSSYSDNDTKVMLLGDVDFTANSQVITFEEGDYYFRSLDMTRNNLQLEPKGNVRIFIQGDLTLAKNNAAFSDPAASLFFFVGGDLSLSSQGGGGGDLSAFFYVKGDVAIDANSGNAEIYGGITAEGRIDVSGNGFTFKYNKYGADQFGLGECDLCYDPPTGPNGISILGLLDISLPIIFRQDVYVPIKNISPIPLDNVQVFEAKRSLLDIDLGINHEVVDKEGINVPGTSTYRSSALYADLPLGLHIGLANGYVIYDIGDGYHSYILTDVYYQLHKEAFISADLLDFSELIYFGKYTDNANRNYNIRLDLCREVDIPPSYQTGPFDAWDTFRGDTNGDGKFDDKNISTKIAGKTFSLTIANLDADQTGVEAKSIPSTTAITKTYTDVSLASRNVHVGFTFCSLFDGTTYTLLEDGECSGNEIALCKNIDNSNPKWRKCYSSDAFAIRPKAFSITPPSGEDIGLLTSGSTHRFTVIAENENNTNTTGYNQEDNNLTIAQRLLFKNGDEDNQSILHGTLSFSNNNFLFVDGISKDRDDAAKTETVGITFSDVGRVDIILEDRQWGSVDSDDTPEGCDGGTLTNAKGIMLTIPDGTHICGEN